MDAFRSHATHPGPRLERREKWRWGKWRMGAAKELEPEPPVESCEAVEVLEGFFMFFFWIFVHFLG